MVITQLASPAEHRAAAARAAAAYTQLAAVSLHDAVLATSAQHMADTHRVLAALWSKASGALDPESAFFRLASSALTSATAVPGPTGARPAVQIAAVRRSWTATLGEMNIPLVFPAALIPEHVPAPDWAAARARYLHGMSPERYVQARRDQAATLGGATGVLAGVDAYLVDAAAAAGDHALVTVYARWAWLVGQVRADTPVDSAQAIARSVLGPIESVRAAQHVDL